MPNPPYKEEILRQRLDRIKKRVQILRERAIRLSEQRDQIQIKATRKRLFL